MFERECTEAVAVIKKQELVLSNSRSQFIKIYREDRSTAEVLQTGQERGVDLETAAWRPAEY